MTATIGGADRASAHLAVTRAGWHRVAEHILASALYQATGKIGLVPSPGGFRTPPFGTDGRFLAVDGTELVAGRGGGIKRTPLTTIRAAAEFAGVTPGAPAEVYQPATPLDLDGPLVIESDAARLLAQWYGLGAAALSRFAAEIPGDKPTTPVLWPEHFDVGTTITMASGERVNLGASPGDDYLDEPYAYIGPWGDRRGDPAFWNAPFGAARPRVEVSTVESFVEFLRVGLSLQP